MIIDTETVISDLNINSLLDLRKLTSLEKGLGMKFNRSALGRKLGVDRRTVTKYIHGFQKSKTFSYKSVLYRYMKDMYGLECAESSFRRYLSKHKEFDDYFHSVRHKHPGGPAISRYETGMGEQAQLDWKESISFLLCTGEVIVINIFVLILSYSRFRVYQLSLTKTQDVLFHYMNKSFEIFGGVPKVILTDNMKTVMDELSAYNGDLDYEGLVKKLDEINNRENSRFHTEYQSVPVLSLEKEKEFLLPLPQDKIRNSYKIVTETVKVNKSSMISYKSNQYSVPSKCIGKQLKIQVYDEQIHLYDHEYLVAIHNVSARKMNYNETHYIDFLSKTLPFERDKLVEIARENLQKIGERYNHEHNI